MKSAAGVFSRFVPVTTLALCLVSCAHTTTGNVAATSETSPPPTQIGKPAPAPAAPDAPAAIAAATQDVPAELSAENARVVLRWQTETESNAFGYYVYRADSTTGAMHCINQEDPVHASGTSTVPLKYAYFDLTVKAGQIYYYKLQSRDLDGTTEWVIGDPEPVKGTAKALSAADLEEIRTKGRAYKEEAK